jgi:hypothetical protein
MSPNKDVHLLLQLVEWSYDATAQHEPREA